MCVDLPTTVDDVRGHLERELDCTVDSIKTIFSAAKVKDKSAPFFGTGFSRYEINLSIPSEIKKDEIIRYFEDNLHCNVVYYMSPKTSQNKNMKKK